MKLEQAQLVSQSLLQELKDHFKKLEVVGSIRRKCETVHDIDLVGIRKPESEYGFGEASLEYHISILDPTGPQDGKTEGISRFSDGKKIKRFKYNGIMIDLYLADNETFECIKLIRTGSAEHNVRLTQLARQKNLKLFASGKGLCKVKGGIYNNEPEEIIEVVESTEDGILQYLLGKIPNPEDRRN